MASYSPGNHFSTDKPRIRGIYYFYTAASTRCSYLISRSLNTVISQLRLVPSFWAVSVPERLREPPRFELVSGAWRVEDDSDSGSDGPSPSKRGSVAKAALVIR